jgi:hypothetical protein
MNKKVIEKRIYTGFLELLKAYNYFVGKYNYSFRAEYSFGHDRISINLRQIGTKYYLQYTFLKRIDSIEAIWLEYLKDINLGNQSPNSFMTIASSIIGLKPELLKDVRYHKYGYILEPTETGINRYLDEAKLQINKIIIPFLSKYNKVNELDSLFNNPPDKYIDLKKYSNQGVEFRKMIIAKLAGNPDYEKVCSAMKTLIESWIKQDSRMTGYMTVYEKVHKKLKDIKPLENPNFA